MSGGNKIGDINVTIGGNNNATGDIGHKIFTAPPPRRIDDEFKGMFLSNFPHGRKIKIRFHTAAVDAQGLANDFAEFLRQNGYPVDGPNPFLFLQPLYGVHVGLQKNNAELPIEIDIGFPPQ